jgi:hypothetical protein
MDLVQRIHLNLSVVRVSLSAAIAKLLARGETIEHIEAVSSAVCESGKAFERETEKQVSTPWQRCCGRGRWIRWVCPCVPLYGWLRQRTTRWYEEAREGVAVYFTRTLTTPRGAS